MADTQRCTMMRGRLVVMKFGDTERSMPIQPLAYFYPAAVHQSGNSIQERWPLDGYIPLH